MYEQKLELAPETQSTKAKQLNILHCRGVLPP
jgi:hypothetical protein